MKDANENIGSLPEGTAASREEYAELVEIWEASSRALNGPVFDTAAAWKKLRSKVPEDGMVALPAEAVSIQPADTGAKAISRSILRYSWLAAACVLVAVAGWWYFGARSQAGEKTLFAADSNLIFTFPDSSIVHLRKGSKLTWSAETLSTGHGPRVATLEGEAFFEVRHNSASPFRINTRQAIIEDLGTSFAIRQEDTACQVLVTAGTVKCTARNSSAAVLILTAGEQAQLGTGSWIRYRGADPNFLAWKDHTLTFDQTPLDSVLAAVQDRYGVPVTLSANLRTKADKIKITARWGSREQLKDVLEEIRLTTGLVMQKKKDTIIFVAQ